MDNTLAMELAKQRASVKWLLSKAFNNRVPENLKEPFFRDHEGHDHLKPQIVVELGNATLYCQALSNLYSDPNYQSLNHWSILQTLSRKGVPLNEINNIQLTETVLIQTNPLRVQAHMSVIEAIMALYAKEVATHDRISAVINRISGGTGGLPSNVQGFENTLLYWVSHACSTLKRRIDQSIEMGATDENGVRLQAPYMPPIRSCQDLCDGVCIAFLIANYCPSVLPWTLVRVNHLPSVEDSIHNILLVLNFSQKHLPYSVFHMMPEDISYMRGSMRTNLIALLADLFNLLEIHPVNCVEQQQMSVVRSPSGTQLKRPSPPKDSFTLHSADQMTIVQQQQQPPNPHQSPFQQTEDNGFVVHKSRGVPTLASIHHHQQQQHQQQQQQDPLIPARLRMAKEKTNADSKADERGDTAMIAAGRPSDYGEQRRPSYAGRRSRRTSLSDDSQLTIENFGGSQDHLNLCGRLEKERERERKISTASMGGEPAVAIRSSIQDARGTLQIGYDMDVEPEKQDRETEKLTGGLKRLASVENVRSGLDEVVGKKTTSFATLPNTTTWQQQSIHHQQVDSSEDLRGDDNRSLIDATKLSSVRMKLEEKRRQIEKDKRKFELALFKQQQKVGQAAFLQAINKDITCDMESKWADGPMETKRTPDLDQMDMEQYQQIIAQLNSNLHVIQSDIQRLANQQSQNQAHNQQAQQLFQAQQIANMINQYGSQQNLSTMGVNDPRANNMYPHPNRSPMQQQQNYGSTPHLPQYHQQMQQQQQQMQYGNNGHGGGGGNYGMHSGQQQMNRDYMPNQYVDDQGRYVQQQPQNNMGYGGSQQLYNRSNSYNQMANNGGDPYDNYNRNDGGYQQQVQQHLPMPLHKNYLSREHLNQPQYYNDGGVGGAPPGQMQSNQFYLHDQQQQQQQQHQSPPVAPQRRTWAQSAAAQQQNQHRTQLPLDVAAWSQNSPHNKSGSAGSSGSSSGGGFMLHQNGDNNGDSFLNNSSNALFPVHTSSPQHHRAQRQISQIIESGSQKADSPNRLMGNSPAATTVPDMAPQSISFIGDEDAVDLSATAHKMKQLFHPQTIHNKNGNDSGNLEASLGKLNISSGSRTYRIPSPTRPVMNSRSFQDPNAEEEDPNNGKGFYISFDNEPPKRPKPPLRTKRMSPKKEQGQPTNNMDEHGMDNHMMNDRFATTTRKSANDYKNMNNINSHTNSSSSNKYNQYGEDRPSEPIPAKRHHISDMGGMMSNRMMHENYSGSDYDQSQSPPLQQSQQQQYMSNNRKHLEDVTNYDSQPIHHNASYNNNSSNISSSINNNHHQQMDNNNIKTPIIIGNVNLDPDSVDEMERKKEKIMLLSLQRRQQQEEAKARKEIEAMQRREREQMKEEEKSRKKEEQAARRQVILEQHKLKKAIEEAEREGKVIDKADLLLYKQQQQQMQSASSTMRRPQKVIRPRPKTIHVESGSVDLSEESSLASSRGKKGSNTNLTGMGRTLSSTSMKRDYYRGSQDSLTVRDSGLGRATPPRRAPSPGMGVTGQGIGRHMPSPSGPGSLPPGLMTKRRIFDDGSSDISSNQSSMMDYTGPKLYKQPAAKSNRGIILNAVEYCVFPGVVNRDAKMKVLDKIARSDVKHFLILFRDTGCQFRALYGYNPETEHVAKLYGTGPGQVDEYMFDKFFKYNSGGKCFSQIHTKHLTVTIDAFTIHNSLWQGKKVPNLPSKKDMTLVI